MSTNTDTMVTYRRTSADALKRTAESLGSFFFTPGAMRFFNSRLSAADVLEGNDGSWLFITSEKSDVDACRLYTVRRAEVANYGQGDVFNVTDVSEFQEFMSLKRARVALNAAVLDAARKSVGLA